MLVRIRILTNGSGSGSGSGSNSGSDSCIPEALFQAYIYPHKQSLLSQTIFLLFSWQNRTLTALYTFLLLLGPLPRSYWRCRIMVSTGPLSLTMGSPSLHSYTHIPTGGGLWHLPPLEMTLNLGQSLATRPYAWVRRLLTPLGNDFGLRQTGLTSGPMAWTGRLLTPLESDFGLKPTAWAMLHLLGI